MNESQNQHRDKTCFFTGHRDIPQENYPAIQQRLEKAVEALIAQGVCYFGVGGALGFDTIAALTVIKLKARYPQIRLVMILPCKNHDFSWQGEDKALFEKIADRADKLVYTSERYYNGCMYKRNRHMAEGSGWCICYIERPTGGTAYTVSYARSVGVRMINLADNADAVEL
jgi:uncharacterized phage-like protein YoqJ